MSKSSVQTSQTVKPAIGANSAQPSQARPASAWSKGPPTTSSVPLNSVATANSASPRSQSPSNGFASRSQGHSRRPSTLGPGASKEVVTIPKGVPPAKRMYYVETLVIRWALRSANQYMLQTHHRPLASVR